MRLIHTLSAAAVLLAATAVQAMPTAIQFDGYCDGLGDIVVNANGTVTATWTNNDCAGGSAPAIAQRSSANRMMGATGHYVGTDWLLVRVNDNHTWTYYGTDGSEFNWGTWSDASMARNVGTRSSVQR